MTHNTQFQYIKYKKKYTNLKHANIKHINLTIKQPWFNLIKASKKTIEGRLNKGIFTNLKPNDIIIWQHEKLKLKVIVKFINHYGSFKEMLLSEGLPKVLPTIPSIENGVNIYHKYFSPDEEEKYGVVAIGMQIINEQDDGNDVLKLHIMKLQEQYYNSIKNGEKIFELRVNDEKRQQIKINDIIIFDYDKNLLQTEVVEIKKYNSFGEAIDDTNIQQLLPNNPTKIKATEIYENFNNGQYKIDAQTYGVVRFKLQLCDKINKHNTNYLHISEPWLTQIKLGNKIVEGRKGNNDKYKNWVKKYAVFYNNKLTILVMVKEIRHYATLYDYLNYEKPKNVAPHIGDNYDEVVKAYHEFVSDAEIEEVGGFNGLVIELIGVLH
jgi:ASC-1-like (ASCH) protein